MLYNPEYDLQQSDFLEYLIFIVQFFKIFADTLLNIIEY